MEGERGMRKWRKEVRERVQRERKKEMETNKVRTQREKTVRAFGVNKQSQKADDRVGWESERKRKVERVERGSRKRLCES